MHRLWALTFLVFGLAGLPQCQILVSGEASSPAANCVEGQKREGYLAKPPKGPDPCPKAVQTCVQGRWQGSRLVERCPQALKNCGSTPHGGIEAGYLQETSSLGTPCPRGQRTCLNGRWVGPVLYDSCTEH
jgi:hypothetical protein